jgi:cold shock CspA family protein
VTPSSVEAILQVMVDDLLSGRVTSFRREQGFGVITLDDGRDVKFDASDCTMVPEEGAVVRLRIGPARWGGGIKALHVEPKGSSTLRVPSSPPSLDEQIAALQREHLVGGLSEHVMAELVGRAAGTPALIDLLDAYYAADAARARPDGYLRFVPPLPTPADAMAVFADALPGVALPRPSDARTIADTAALVNQALESQRDPRRLWTLATGSNVRAYYLMASDRARRLARFLPFRP